MTSFASSTHTSLADGLMLTVERSARESLSSQIRRSLRDGIRQGRLKPGSHLPSTRALAEQLGISRPVVVEAYAQLGAEGYLVLRQGTRPVVSAGLASAARREEAPARQALPIRFDLRPAIPDLAMFPRQAWLRSIRSALLAMTADDLGYGDPQGCSGLRGVIADYLARVRGVVATPNQIFITSGFAEGRALACAAMRTLGIDYLGVEDPSYSDWTSVIRSGLHRVPIPVDADGLDVAALEASNAQALFITPAHQFPTGGVLSSARRQKLVHWLGESKRIAVEDDYDAEFRYDHAPVGALQGLAPEQVVYAGTVSKTLAPGLRLGWLVVPQHLVPTFGSELRRWSEGPPRIDQRALMHFMETGAYDRHLRRMRRVYRRRRDVLLEHLASATNLRSTGAAAGLHITVELPRGMNEEQVCAALRERGVAVESIARYRVASKGPPTLLIGYGRASESTLKAGAEALNEVLGSVSTALE